VLEWMGLFIYIYIYICIYICFIVHNIIFYVCWIVKVETYLWLHDCGLFADWCKLYLFTIKLYFDCLGSVSRTLKEKDFSFINNNKSVRNKDSERHLYPYSLFLLFVNSKFIKKWAFSFILYLARQTCVKHFVKL